MLTTLANSAQGRESPISGLSAGRADVSRRHRSVVSRWRTGTRIAWDRVFFRHLWVVTLSGFESVDLALVLEPCTTRPYRLDEAIPSGTAVSLGPGDERTFWSEVESVDRGSLLYERR